MSSQGGLRERLASLRAALLPFAGLGAGAFHPVMIRPSLGFALVPKPKDRPESDAAAVRRERSAAERMAAVLAQSEAAGHGLVDGSKSDATEDETASRQGLRGMSAAGQRKIEDLCALVRQDRSIYGMWTVTLPHEAAEHLNLIPDGAQLFGDTIRRRFGEALTRACKAEQERTGIPCPDHWWFVVEPQSSGRPHWHFVFRCKARRGRGWLLGKGRLDRLIRNAFRTVCGIAYPVKAAGNVQALRKDPGSYLGKYLRKAGQVNAADVVLRGGWSLNLVPHRWTGCSRSAHDMLQRYVFELPSVAVGWLSRQWQKLDAIGRIQASIWQPEAEGAPSMVVGRWLGIGGLEEVVSHLFALAERAYPLGRTFGIT